MFVAFLWKLLITSWASLCQWNGTDVERDILIMWTGQSGESGEISSLSGHPKKFSETFPSL